MKAYHKRGGARFEPHVDRFVRGDYADKAGRFHTSYPRTSYHGQMSRFTLISIGILESTDKYNGEVAND